MSPGAQLDLRGTLQATKSAVTRLRNALSSPTLTPSERYALDSERQYLQAAVARLDRALRREMGAEVSP